MTTLWFLFGVSLTARWTYLAMSWNEDRARRRMLRAVARIKYRHRSRTPGGSAQTPGSATHPQGSLSGRVMVERRRVCVTADAAPPLSPTADAVAVTAASAPSPVGTGVPRNPVPTGLQPACMWIDGCRPT